MSDFDDRPSGVQVEENTEFIQVAQDGKSRQWLYDRVHGYSKKSKKKSRPPSFLCWPSPILKWQPWLLEENSCCTTIGRIGFMHPENIKARRWFLNIAVFLNIYGMLLAILGGASFIPNYNVIRYTSISTVTITSPNITNYFLQPVTMNVGLRSIGLTNADGSLPETVIDYHDFCDLMNNGDNLELIMDPNNCQECRDSLPLWTVAFFVSVVLFVPTIASDILRLYPRYDVNCEKVYAAVLSLISISGLIATWIFFVTRCVASFPGSKHVLLGGGDDSQFGPVQIEFEFGVGLGCLMTAIILKTIAIILNCCVPTPEITRSQREQQKYESLPYLS